MKNWGGLAVAACLLAGSGMAGAEKAEVAALAWLAGSWQGTAGGVEMEELWLPSKGGAMVGLHRDVAGGRMVSFRLVESAKGRVVFANPQHDFPQRILYWLADDGLLHARIEGEQRGKPANEEWAWRRVQ